ncbi:MAG: hypothetical protein PHE36_04410 [Novosphingobium sp.]|nr:hypothetical protein [Novosphingobium sp.]
MDKVSLPTTNEVMAMNPYGMLEDGYLPWLLGYSFIIGCGRDLPTNERISATLNSTEFVNESEAGRKAWIEGAKLALTNMELFIVETSHG